MKLPTYSIYIPFIKIIHFNGWHKIGESQVACFNGWVHYNKNSLSIGKSMRNPFGDMIHYDKRSKCIGYSTYTRWDITTHYDNLGNYTGYSHIFLKILYFHIWVYRTNNPIRFDQTHIA